MGKKKNRQNSNMAVNVDCTEPWDSTSKDNPVTDSDKTCGHIDRGLKKWKNSENFKNSKEHLQCGYCKTSPVQTDLPADTKISLQLCLCCGACSCGPDGENHAERHYKTPHSDCHCLTIDMESLNLWCYECKLQPVIPQRFRSRIDEIKERIKNISEKHHQPPRKSTSAVTSESHKESKTAAVLQFNKENVKALPIVQPKVKGLSNLGNTCFFNSVLQCLAQTPRLNSCLNEMKEGGEEISIITKDSEPIRGTLEKKIGPVGGRLLDLINEMTNNDGKSVVAPRELMSELRKKCPQLMDGDQHDSHELLRQLLDVVLNEDLKRYRRIILKHTGYLKYNGGEILPEERKLLKELDNLVSEQYVMKPYDVFRGTLVSELQCEVCHNISSREEGFLDLSLPVNVEKPQPPAFARRKYLNNANSMNGAPSISISEFHNNYKTENEIEDVKRRRIVRRGKQKIHSIRDHGEGSITEEEKKENDADVEDNVEMGVDDQKEVFESGYSSEKPASSRTSPTAESRQSNGDADDSACASPSASISMQSECNQQVSAAVSAALADLTLDVHSNLGQQVPADSTLHHHPDPICTSMPVPNVTPYTESDNSTDSSTRANPGFSSPDLSTESLQDNPSQERSCGSDHDDSQSFQSKDASLKDLYTQEPLPNCQITDTTVENLPEVYNETVSITSLEGPSCTGIEECGPRTKRSRNEVFDVEEDIQELKEAILLYKNGSRDGYESVSNDEAQNVCSRPSSRLELDSKARSSPVDDSKNRELDVERVGKVLENIISTEKFNDLDSKNGNGENDMHSNSKEEPFFTLVEEIKSDFERNVSKNPPSNNGCLGFVLVGGITSTKEDELSTVVNSTSSNEVPNSDLVQTPMNISNDPDGAEVNPDLYKKNHMTLAPRYQCEEGECSVLSCLNHFTAIEMMAGNNKAGCDLCTQRQNKGKEKDAKTVYTNSTKRLLISKPPPVLILHLKRFQVQMRSFRKLSCHVTFPLILDIAPFCSKSCEKLLDKGQTQILYSLYGVVEHSGTLHGGHYVAYIKVRGKEQESSQPREGPWYYISDSHVSPVKEETVLKTEAYLLFYERIL